MYLVLSLVIVLAIGLTGIAAAAMPVVRPAVVVLPYLSFAVFVAGVAWKVGQWARSPVPFSIPTTAGQQASLAGVAPARLDNPSSPAGVAGRMALEVLLFRSLFRNTETVIAGGPRLVVRDAKMLWLAALAFHWSLVLVIVRHLRFFLEPVPRSVRALSSIDAFFQSGITPVYATDMALACGLLYLLGRRLVNVRVRFLSLFTDYLALGLLAALATTGLVMRHVTRVEVATVKQFAMGLALLSPWVPPGLGAWFFAHLFLACALVVYLPFSKLMHAPGVFLSPTRNLASDSRARRHVNPWNPPAAVHSYEQWENEFRDRLKAAGLPVERP